MFMEFIDENGKSMGGIKLYGDDAKQRLDAMTPTEFVDFCKIAAETFVSLKVEACKAKERENNVIIAQLNNTFGECEHPSSGRADTK